MITKILNDLIADKKSEIDDWFEKYFRSTPPFFYNSVDIRNSGFKMSPVDTNLFPGGFNNLNLQERSNAVKITKTFLEKTYPNISKILILAEDHTRNLFYFENIAVLQKILEDAGYEVKLSSLLTGESKIIKEFESKSGKKIILQPLEKINNNIKTLSGFTPELIIMNNDFTQGEPELFQNITQPITPPLGLGWHTRRKTGHFDSYNEIARNFCLKFNIDPWLISAYFSHCGLINFKEQTGIECVAANVDKTLFKIKQKYREYNIDLTPYVFVKSDRGTYGMGIMTARSSEEILSLNKDARKKMNAIKGGTANTEVIIQEGIPTVNTVNSKPAEPMLYLIGGEPVGYIYRVNNRQDAFSNLNSSGMEFTGISYHNDDKKLCTSLALISKLAAYAAAWECYMNNYII